MAPFTFNPVTSNLISVAIGLAFGFTLERSGFGNARILAAQFYFYNMRVFKVMFTAIITAMVLIFFSSAMGWLDFSLVWVPPTYLSSGIVGGLLLGFGFIIGGYCPGTSFVALSTFKVDALFFVGGLVCGMFIFAETIGFFWEFWHQSVFLGRLTLGDWLGVDNGLLAAVIFVGALCCFFVAEKVEDFFGGRSLMAEPTNLISRFRKIGALTGVGLALVALGVGQPDLARKVSWAKSDLDKKIAERTYHIDPGEVLSLMYNPQIEVILLDVRGENDYNPFHLLGAKRVDWKKLVSEGPGDISSQAIVVLMSNDEQKADEAFRYFAAQKNINQYIMAGGINRWLDIFKDEKFESASAEQAPSGDDTPRHVLTSAQGDRHPSARPNEDELKKRSYQAKVKVLTAVKPVGGGCGG